METISVKFETGKYLSSQSLRFSIAVFPCEIIGSEGNREIKFDFGKCEVQAVCVCPFYKSQLATDIYRSVTAAQNATVATSNNQLATGAQCRLREKFRRIKPECGCVKPIVAIDENAHLMVVTLETRQYSEGDSVDHRLRTNDGDHAVAAKKL